MKFGMMIKRKNRKNSVFDKKKRVAIVSISNTENVVNRYVKFLILELKKSVNKIIVCLENDINMKDKHWITNSVDDYLVSVGEYDANRWKSGILMLGEEISAYDEMILINDTCYGPLYSFDKIFERMKNVECDFWGMTKHGNIFYEGERVAETFLQTYMTVYRKRIMDSEKFVTFWNNVSKYDSFDEYEKKFEFSLFSFFEQAGFKGEAFCDTNDWENGGKYPAISYPMILPYELVQYKDFPFVSKSCMESTFASRQFYESGMQLQKLFDYIEEKTDYDINMIYENVLKTKNVCDIISDFNLTYVLDIEKNVMLKKTRVALIVYLFYEEDAKRNVEKLLKLDSLVDVYIFTPSVAIKGLVEKLARKSKYVNSIVVNARGREWATFLNEGAKVALDYEIVGFLHDKRSHDGEFYSIGKSFQDLLWDNMICSKNYVKQIIKLFEKEYLGVLLPPVVMHGNYFKFYSNFWTICFEETQKLAKMIGIQLDNIDKEKTPISIGSVFWAKTQAIRPLLEMTISREDFPKEPMAIDGSINHALERIVPYVAQSQGMLTGYIISNRYANMVISRDDEIIRKLEQKIEKELPQARMAYCDYIKGI